MLVIGPAGVAIAGHGLGVQVLHRWTINNRPRGGEAAAVAGAIPASLRAIPLHETSHVGAHGRQCVEVAIAVSISCDLFAINLENLTTTGAKRSERTLLCLSISHKMLRH